MIVTGAGQGLGRVHALEFARQGAAVVVNDIDSSREAAQAVVDEIRALGGRAVVSTGDVSDWAYGERLVREAVETFGGLHTLVNNAGINRDRMLVNMSEQEWDLVLRVDLKGHFVPMRHAAAYWRDAAKAGRRIAARVVNTSSGAGLMGSVGQGNYGAAKAGIAALTQIAAAEWARYGIVVNAIAPSARTPMTEAVFAEAMAAPETGFDAMDPANVSPLVVWLGSDAAQAVSGAVFEVAGGEVSLADGWRHGPAVGKGARWEPEELTDVVADLIARSEPPTPVYGA
ncbi:NAD(P)-dependent dehydrogenase (short-subunit alcohol dehydrogenase family) [Micromonospora echinospora]|uniref:NAD(P)-dependent dehydrogenase (Short-subunit alcohol dehydrogenase family) n=1 Tax=Micromonospora echinospora TaxID=1877 RepID=A0ABR6MDC6_MICEC|nr:NAD(P)-dependent dehydrogenase (short-subunit alcohol dehydrogenase family) [Micromonospora echinospora]